MNSLLTIQELSQILKISKKTIYGWVHDNYVPYMKLGGAVRFRERDIEIWLARRSRAGRVKRRIEV
ncbi:hypothetical protein ES703_47293 [subsurface metagenome]